MTRALAALALLPLLGACVNDPLPRANTPEEAACRSEAERAPEVRAIYERMPPAQNATARERVMGEVTAAERNAYLRCMRARGLAPRGGVEPVRPLQ
ncbi:hypothetical protein SAMN02745194_04759 [Roseomonas rosea]|jgi:hypothetical protein|uniref:Uncharacterized protein n=1 Tax=Muricoccus roseus TaxID=198092 RepID=A0A1M6RTU7_9PROT|nr:hypothetical protein [Roseomonas rosea]SHK35846.1 hypothetical protein SAMN02745194_04759 [Roseomonas rosea]